MLFVTIVVNFILFGLGVLGSCFIGIGSFPVLSQNTAAGIFTLLTAVFLFAMCVTYIAQGVVLVQARGEFKAVADTDHADQQHIATAFRKLRTVFLIEVIFSVLSVLMNIIQLISTIVSDVPVGGFPGMGPGGGGFGPGGGGFGGGL